MSDNELRDALADLYADGGQAGCEQTADEFFSEPEGAYEAIMAKRFKVRDESREFFLTEWGERKAGDWPVLQRVLAAIAKARASRTAAVEARDENDDGHTLGAA